MNSRNQLGAVLGSLALGVALAVSAPSARANVYATNIKLNGGMTNLALVQGASVAISYILNEPASAGVTIKILSGTTAVRTLTLAGGAPGTLRGLNSNVLWDGKNDQGQNVPPGNYTVSITAASSGYPCWTALTDDTNPGNYVWEARGIAVDRNPASPYYGRVFVGNSQDHTASSTLPGDYLGIQKLNADGSYADEGGFSTGGVAWDAEGTTPWKIRVSADDQVYVGAFVELGNSAGDIYRFDGTLSSNSMLHVFAPPANKSLGEWSGFCLTGAGTNTLLWAADDLYPGSKGIKKFAVKADGTFDPGTGTQMVGVGGSSSLQVGPFAVAVDGAGAIYTVQKRDAQDDSLAQVLRFPAYAPSTNSSLPETNADWVAGPGTNDEYCGARGIAVAPTGTYVAACFWGYFDDYNYNFVNGNLKVLNAATGAVVTNLDLGPITPPYDPAYHIDTDCDWDAAGNLYYLDDSFSCWRAFSPPGANQATTVALPVVQISSLTAPTITSISVASGMVTISFTGGSSDPASAFALFSSSNVSGSYALVPSAVITGSAGHYQATVATNGPKQFYRIQR